MKKIHQTLKATIAIAVVTIFVACKKDAGLSRPLPTSVVSEHEVLTISNTGTSYTGSSTLGDSVIRKTSYTPRTVGATITQN